MDEKQILKEIAYYSKLINNHKKSIESNPKPSNFNLYKATAYTKNNVTSNAYNMNKYKYVKPQTSVIQKLPNKVLINPNFNKTVHINPNFHKNGLKILPEPDVAPTEVEKLKVLINPKIINVNFFNKKSEELSMGVPEKVTNPKLLSSERLEPYKSVPKPIVTSISNISPRKRKNSIRSKYKIVKSTTGPQSTSSYDLKISPRKRRNSVKTKYKIIKSTLGVSKSPIRQTLLSSELKNSPGKRRLSVKSKYKIVKATHSSRILGSSKVDIPSRKRRNSVRTKYKIVKSSVPKENPFKIDHRIKKPVVRKKKVILSDFDSIRTCLFKNKVWKSSKMLSLVKPRVSESDTLINNKVNKRSLITLRGQKYTTALNKKSLKIVSTQNCNKVGSNVTERKNVTRNGKYRKMSLSQKRIGSFTNLRNSILRKNNLNKTERSSFRKNNIPCPVYCRYGKCRRKDAGRCIFKHNPDQIALCKNFLQGACLDDNCLLSHKVSLEKMPTCKYFLEGCCVRPNCQYLHVKISPNADICKNFLEGFCKDGIKCNKRHQFLCPDFEKYNKCEKLRCRYPHIKKCVSTIPNSKIIIKVPKKEEKASKNLEKLSKVIEEKPETDRQQGKDTQRYYVGSKEESSKVAVSDKKDDESYQRVKLGTLPAFIPFE